ncbi:MAG: glycine cleavage system aminomethyltransferase GcvT [Methylobacter sp.]|uniref:glycine cleavage system aminomethyltransferase GcvT n=1 Tax=Methylobacter sp. TaxID=2051955 RepID=UPI00272FA6FE|nr:glycine cleavage system aminomethyltransferase GcvT [Methylobacter sp.]MDP1664978.1 glycine cleavage system aminomethyltransferase GcvT [Methylobacter sp.]MDP1971320.1 glycine cleavage system aminomethyltransferase GcvT [Methylobacter sp.]
MLKQTPLYNLHLELGARMVPFAGYLMPVQYGKGTLHEHLHCRSHAGFFDISHMGQCLILGDDAVDELERLAPGDIAALKSGEQKYTVLTNNNGGIIDDIVITRIDTGLMIIVNAACKDKDFKYLYSRLSGRCCFNELTGQALFALQGPAAVSVIEKFSAQAAELSFMQACGTSIKGIKCNISRSGYTGEDGFEILVGHHYAEQLARLLLAEEAVEPIGLAARDTLRLEAGLSLYGHELNESITPVEAGLQWLLKKGGNQFPGADKILAQLQYGPEKIRVGLLVDGKIPVREGSVICNSEGSAVGYVTSGSFSPSLGRPIAMALLDPYTVDLDNPLYTMVRDHRITVTMTPLPFVPHRYHR